MNLFDIRNRGQTLVSTTYWDTEHARNGSFYLTWNAGAARLLVPEARAPMLREVARAREVILSRGPWVERGGRDALELLWEDDSDSPFALCLVAEQCDRLLPDAEQGGGFPVVAWARDGEKGRWPGRYRVVARVPWLRPWSAH